MNNEPTTKEILTAVNGLSEKIDSKFIAVDSKFEDILFAINGFAEDVQIKFDKIDEKFEKIDNRFTKIESVMVTKDYLDDKMADLRGDLLYIDKKADNKADAIVYKLQKKKIITKTESDEIINLSPFPKFN